ncbi:N-acetyltransferase [Frankia sp. CNm7]|nr:N-acetyltransferase [Frankia nepalensis]MBL7515528.1 N-acetyltransferase [Frankia nepalensis]MBL7522793.1 N-acetyltransferase [Frankia nepalensis]
MTNSRPAGTVADAKSPPGVFVHPRGLCESDTVGPGTRIWAFAHVMPGAVVGAGCNICDHAFIESGARLGDRVTVKNITLVCDWVTIEDDVFLGPNVLFTNDFRPRAEVRKDRGELTPTVVRRGATLAAGVIVVTGTEIGEYAFVGAGAVITRDVPAHALVLGSPARPVGWACRCGERLTDKLICPACGAAYKPATPGTGLRAAGAGEPPGRLPGPAAPRV